MRILINGHGGHGKDFLAERLATALSLRYVDASLVFAKHLRTRLPLGWYASDEECLADKYQHRAGWYNEWRKFTQDNPTRMVDSVLTVSDIYCGLRDPIELEASLDKFDISIWVVDPSKEREPSSSMRISSEGHDYLFVNPSNSPSAFKMNFVALTAYLSSIRHGGH